MHERDEVEREEGWGGVGSSARVRAWGWWVDLVRHYLKSGQIGIRDLVKREATLERSFVTFRSRWFCRDCFHAGGLETARARGIAGPAPIRLHTNMDISS